MGTSWLVGWLLFMYIHRKLMPYPLHFICMYNICNACAVDTSRYLYCYPFVLIPIHTYWYDVVWLCCGTTLGILICRDCNKTGNLSVLSISALQHILLLLIYCLAAFYPFVTTSHYCIHAVHFVSKDALNKLSNIIHDVFYCVELSAVT